MTCQRANRSKLPLYFYENRGLNILTPFSQVTCRKISGDVSFFKRPRVSRATHLPASLLASGLLPCEMPAPFPSAQAQSLPKINLLRWRTMKSREKSISRESALFPEFADISAYRFGKSDRNLSVSPPGLIGPDG